MRALFGDRSAPPERDPMDDFDEGRSLTQALRVTLLFLAIVLLLMWAGVTEARLPADENSTVPAAGRVADIA